MQVSWMLPPTNSATVHTPPITTAANTSHKIFKRRHTVAGKAPRASNEGGSDHIGSRRRRNSAPPLTAASCPPEENHTSQNEVLNDDVCLPSTEQKSDIEDSPVFSLNALEIPTEIGAKIFHCLQIESDRIGLISSNRWFNKVGADHNYTLKVISVLKGLFPDSHSKIYKTNAFRDVADDLCKFHLPNSYYSKRFGKNKDQTLENAITSLLRDHSAEICNMSSHLSSETTRLILLFTMHSDSKELRNRFLFEFITQRDKNEMLDVPTSHELFKILDQLNHLDDEEFHHSHKERGKIILDLLRYSNAEQKNNLLYGDLVGQTLDYIQQGNCRFREAIFDNQYDFVLGRGSELKDESESSFIARLPVELSDAICEQILRQERLPPEPDDRGGPYVDMDGPDILAKMDESRALLLILPQFSEASRIKIREHVREHKRFYLQHGLRHFASWISGNFAFDMHGDDGRYDSLSSREKDEWNAMLEDNGVD